MGKDSKYRDRAENYLKRIREGDRVLKTKRDELDALRYKASGAGAIRYDKDHVQVSPKDYLSMAMDDIIRIEKEVERMEGDVEDLKGEAYGIVRNISQAEHRTVIEWYYLNGLSMLATADKMNMSERNTYYLREDALDSFGRLIKKV